MNDPVLVTTEFRGVFFGDLESYDEEKRFAVLKNARNCVLWSADVKGVFGLAVTGPTSGCRIGPRMKGIRLEKVTAIINATEEAVTAWEAEPWS